MTIRVALQHKTHYKFDRRVNLSAHSIRLRPAPHSRTHIHSYSLKISPEKHFINWQQDAFGNYLARIVFPEKTDHLSVDVEVIADMTSINPFDFFVEDYAKHFPFQYSRQVRKELTPYLAKRRASPRFKELLNSISLEEREMNDFLVEINQLIYDKVEYCLRMEPGVQTPEQTLKLGSGSCRDSAWLLAQLFRHLGIASRFASGYLVQLTSDEKPIDGPAGPESDFTDLHAWCEVYIPGAGWIGLDPTSGLFTSEGHIPLACTPEPASAAPIEGGMDKCEVEFNYSNEVIRVLEDPRVTKPYSDSQWDEILQLGDHVESLLDSNDIRLTMGGEPTFVSVDDMESAQWNTEALGEDKLRLAKTLLLHLRDEFAPKGFLHYGQGKWYPGEELPRWALGLFWRKDGEPTWNDPSLLARIDEDYGHTIKDAERFVVELTARLGLTEKFLHPAYEDIFHYLSEELKLPIQLDLQKAKEKGDLDRKKLLRLLEDGLKDTTGFVVPVEWDEDLQVWMSSRWRFRRNELVLIPGDSPMGLRLPLSEIQTSERPVIERDTFEERPSLLSRDDFAAGKAVDDLSKNESKKSKKKRKLSKAQKEEEKQRLEAKKQREKERESSDWIITALCIEPRKGKLHIFLPPLRSLESYLLLVTAIEETAKQLQLPVVLEGYEPPKDHRLQKLLVTPDPGVIEVNIHPSSSWRELVDNTQTLYQLAKKSQLSTEKFMLDGRHTGTGGGNHITLGGTTPSDSPLLRRPDLLRSLITFWQHHPSLSYLFSGTFIGPTSQAPRVDEGRDEMLYELEIAFEQMPDGLSSQPWLIDRLLRNILIDITGNTHRAEFCIDKLYSPSGTTGRLGILEFRGFEMPPHSQMSVVQALLIRALVARFWKEPYKKPLVRWGTTLHDQFMLPHYIWQDIKEVVQDLNDHGLDFKTEWLLPFEEFRFPHYGRVSIENIEIELRWAIEPWHVLGEEIGSFGTSRYVDSSIERLQIKISGLTEGRYTLACNGRTIPLRQAGRKGEYVAGVRYRAWAPPSALHPTIGLHTPLIFDLIDTWNGRSIGGCSYHVTHPGGRSYETFPINAVEAESRRVNRFNTVSHSQGSFTPQPTLDGVREFFPNHQSKPMQAPPQEPHSDYPCTLDLRRLNPSQ